MTSAALLLGPNGPLARTLAGYEHRPGQIEMAAAVERALAEDGVLLCEAGTGTGKTLAYLVPALLSRARVIVSTATKALQEQIFFKDLPLIERHLDLRARAVLVKGLANYVCRRRFELVRAGAREGLSEPIRSALPVLKNWIEATRRGDIAELGELAESHPIWSEVTASSETRIGPSCPYYEDCFVTRLRREAEQAELLVANHHLLLAHLAIRGEHPGGVLPPADALVLDEAHKLEDVATSFFGVQLSTARLERLLGDAERAFAAAGAPARAARLVVHARRLGEELFACLAALAPSPDGRQSLPADAWIGPVREAYHALDDALEAVQARADAALDEPKARPAARESLRAVAQRAARTRQELARIAEPSSARVSWIERRAHSVLVASTPVDLHAELRAGLIEPGGGVVLTSATLSAAGSFAFIRARLGLDEPLERPVDELLVASPFDYQARALVYTPADLPGVDEPGFAAAAAERIGRLVSLADGGAFVLCTSLRSMRAIADELEEGLARRPMVQGDAPKSALLDRFREQGDAVLVATMSFWEGVDVPGRALRLVVIDRLPFAVPTDPVFAARSAALEARGISAFAHYALPQAAIVLKQGFGRLLRTREDCGVVAILDRRIREKSYGKVLLASLPPAPSTTQIEEVAAYWRRLTAPRARTAR